MKTLTKAVIGLSAAGAAYVGVQKIRHGLSDELQDRVEVHGFVGPGYEAVRDAFTVFSHASGAIVGSASK
jgi:hypothetical protein